MGGVWGAVLPKALESIIELLNLPANIIPVSIIPFGHIEENTRVVESRFDKTKIHWNKF